MVTFMEFCGFLICNVNVPKGNMKLFPFSFPQGISWHHNTVSTVLSEAYQIRELWCAFNLSPDYFPGEILEMLAGIFEKDGGKNQMEQNL